MASHMGWKLDESDMLFVLFNTTGSMNVKRRALIILYTVWIERFGD